MDLNIQIGQKALITFDNWFFGADGRQYRAAFGTVRAIHTAEETLGVRPNGRSSNWFLEIGRLTVAGCQVHYALQCDDLKLGNYVDDFTTSPEHGLIEFKRPNTIYMAD